MIQIIVDKNATSLTVTGDLKISVPKRWIDESLKIALTRAKIGADEENAVEGVFDTFKGIFNTATAIGSNPLVKMAAGFIPGGRTALDGIEAINAGRKIAEGIKKKIPKKTRKIIAAVARRDPKAVNLVKNAAPMERLAIAQALQLERDYEALDDAERSLTQFDRIVEFE